MANAPNIFARLNKWAFRQDENFLTESLSVVLEMLLQYAPAVGVRVIKAITNGFINVDSEDAGIIEIRTQIETEEGRPDLEISVPGFPDRLVILEVKAESPLRRGQLEGYREYLRTKQDKQTSLVLLTKYAPISPQGCRTARFFDSVVRIGRLPRNRIGRIQRYRDSLPICVRTIS